MSYTKNYLHQNYSSYYNVWDKDPKQVNLEFLLNLSQKYLLKEDKKALPCFQPHAQTAGRAAHLVWGHTGLIQLDFDYKDNPTLASEETRAMLIDEMINSGSVVVAQTSAGGKGVWALLAVEDITRENHQEMADKASLYALDVFGYQIDEPVARNLSSLRFLSPYEDMKINDNAQPIQL